MQIFACPGMQPKPIVLSSDLGTRSYKLSRSWKFNRVDGLLERRVTPLRQSSRFFEFSVRFFSFANRLINLGKLSAGLQVRGIELLGHREFSNRIVIPAAVRIDDAEIAIHNWFRRIAGNEFLQFRERFCELVLLHPRISKVHACLQMTRIILKVQLKFVSRF